MAVRSGLDAALSDDGDSGLVGLEKIRLGKGFGILWDSARAQCGMDADLLWSTTTGLGTGGYHRDVAGDWLNNDGVFPSEESGGLVDGLLRMLTSGGARPLSAVSASSLAS